MSEKRVASAITSETYPGRTSSGVALALLASIFVVAACGLIYELVAGALASYLLGDSILQFSTIIGAYLFSMGVGAYLSRFLHADLAGHFIRIELFVGVVGGFMPLLLFAQYVWAPEPLRLLLYALVFVVGTLVGLELPLVMRLLRQHYRLKDLVSQVMTVDYLGALAVSVAFPLWFVPMLGMVRTGLVFGLANVLVAFWAMWLFRERLSRPRLLAGGAAVAALSLLVALIYAERLTHVLEANLYGDRIAYASDSPYQRLVVTQRAGETRLYLNGNLQFSSSDEYRYHEALVLPAYSAHPSPKRVLILGGGDGLAARELLAGQRVESITLVDLDPAVTSLFSKQPQLLDLNKRALHDPRVTIINTDAFKWVEQDRTTFDLIYIDLPDPTNLSLNKLYTKSFYSMLGERLAGGGFIAMQATSPMYARQSYWSIVRTLEAAGLQTAPYHAIVPSFGEWGFVIAGFRPFPMQASMQRLTRMADGRSSYRSDHPLRFVNAQVLPTLFVFPADMAKVDAPINRLFEPSLTRLYQQEWGRVD